MKWSNILRVLPLLLFLSPAVAAEGAQDVLTGKYDQTRRKGETRATLDPGLFSDARVREAYKAAKEIPWVLDSIYCFCMCRESPAFRHTSLLSCFVDNHAAV